MASNAPIPIALYGKDPKIAEAVAEKLLPDIEVVHCCLTYETALRELPAACAGDNNNTPPPAPASGLGTNARAVDASARKAPQAVLFGGGFSDAEYEGIVRAVRERCGDPEHKHKQNKTIHFVKVQKRDVLAAGSLGPNPEVIARIFRKKLAAAVAREEQQEEEEE
ncbi:hypothetical protein VTK56DRAFT_2578 [Thermocarpiscus australiensis]